MLNSPPCHEGVLGNGVTAHAIITHTLDGVIRFRKLREHAGKGVGRVSHNPTGIYIEKKIS